MKLRNRVAVITGAGAGIGRCSAIEFAREGASVVVADINAAVRETAGIIAAQGGTALAVETEFRSRNRSSAWWRVRSSASRR